ncbi:MAG TPA: acyl-CoA desaturase [Chitinophagales bacterium]|nr:acyl-CoA desaturase [Chitinophagales bacterium]HMX05303.1 acyl-CoA desaturase [Chitinophagales bacterium]HMZ88576.1 acyl-CoA desaturase [Chitinophagales bacterium]HNA58876.1 acyl-CoA desaturase [Chitinophagales bacterium]HNE46546.1 acyl-CoA desaturase [Chitinophagales bacterium]
MTIFFVFFAIHWYLSLFSQTFFLHRYAAHSMFRMNPFWEKSFYLFTWITQGSSYLSPYAYGILHRLHHAFADTEQDPHSPKYTKGIFPLMHKTKQIYSDINSDTFPVDEKYKKNLPMWRSFDHFASSMIVRLLWVAAYFVFYLTFATHWWMWLLFPITVLMGPVHGAIINYFAHKFGYRNFQVEDTSKNFLPVDVLMMGESYHNNHHKFGSRPNFGVRWFELDPTYPLIKILHALHIIRLNKETAA